MTPLDERLEQENAAIANNPYNLSRYQAIPVATAAYLLRCARFVEEHGAAIAAWVAPNADEPEARACLESLAKLRAGGT